MRVSVSLLNEWFHEYNDKYFGGRLPAPVMEVGMSRTLLGTMSVKKRRLFKKIADYYTIRISNYYDVSETEFKNVLLHEMIHLHIASSGLKDTSPHGVLFHKMMDAINADGWHISVSTKMTGVAKNATRRRVRPRVILAVEMTDGKRLLSVVSPRYVRSIDRVLGNSRNLKSFRWYVSTDDYFADFPSVRTPKGRIVERATYERLLSTMQPLSLSNNNA